MQVLDKTKPGIKRPLNGLSDYVTEDLPSHLGRGDTLLIQRQTDSTSRLALAQLETGELNLSDRRLAHLDVHLLRAGLKARAIAIPESLKTLVGAVNERSTLPNGLTYQDLVFSNPLETDPRRLFEGSVGDSEQLFYEVHRSIEARAAQVILKTNALIDYSMEGSLKPGEMTAGIENILPDLDFILQEMDRLFINLSYKDFRTFRSYLSGGNDTIPGPSAKFSPGMFTIDALSLGDYPSKRSTLEHKYKEKDVFPDTDVDKDGFAGQKDMEKALNRISLHGLSVHFNPQEAAAFKKLTQKLEEFRKIHLRMVGRFLKDILRGTAGEEILPYLKEIRDVFTRRLREM